MSTVRFSQVTFATKSWVAEAWEKMVVELFSGRVVAEVKQLDEVCESKWEVELKKLQNEVHSLCHHAIHQLLPIAGSYQQALLDDVAKPIRYTLRKKQSLSSTGETKRSRISKDMYRVFATTLVKCVRRTVK